MPLFLNDKPVQCFNFSGGECQVKISNSTLNLANIVAILNNSDAIMQLLLTVDAIRRVNPNATINLTIPYFPYARQDRVCNPGEAFSAEVMAGLINTLRCKEVIIVDPHSDVTAALLDNVKVITQSELIAQSPLAALIKSQKLTLVSPDKGASTKTKEAGELLNADVIYASKVRDTLTGKILSSEIHGEVKNKNLIILDDICDGGATFTELAKTLKSQGAKDIYLYVTHGIFSKGLSPLKEHFKHVYCYHSLINEFEQDKEFLTLFKR